MTHVTRKLYRPNGDLHYPWRVFRQSEAKLLEHRSHIKYKIWFVVAPLGAGDGGIEGRNFVNIMKKQVEVEEGYNFLP